MEEAEVRVKGEVDEEGDEIESEENHHRLLQHRRRRRHPLLSSLSLPNHSTPLTHSFA